MSASLAACAGTVSPSNGLPVREGSAVTVMISLISSRPSADRQAAVRKNDGRDAVIGKENCSDIQLDQGKHREGGPLDIIGSNGGRSPKYEDLGVPLVELDVDSSPCRSRVHDVVLPDRTLAARRMVAKKIRRDMTVTALPSGRAPVVRGIRSRRGRPRRHSSKSSTELAPHAFA